MDQKFLDQVVAGATCKEVAAATTLEPHETVVHASVTAATGNYTVTLPSVAEARGKVFFIHATRSANALTLTHAGDSRNWGGDYTLDADNDGIALLSDGRKWWAICNQIAG